MPNRIVLHGHAIEVLKTLEPDSIDCVITSPPYWQLRHYGVPPAIFGGEPDCSHSWIETRIYIESGAIPSASARFIRGGAENAEMRRATRWQTHESCAHCGAWRGQLGLEPTAEQYAEDLGLVLDELHRVLKPSGLLFLNIADRLHHRSLQAVPARIQIHLLDLWSLRGIVTMPRLRKPENRTPLDEVLIIASKAQGRDQHYWNRSAPMANQSVWPMPKTSDRRGHNASFHTWLPKQCLLLGCPEGGTVLDPFCGSGSTLDAAYEMGRHAIGIELNPDLVGQIEAAPPGQLSIFC